MIKVATLINGEKVLMSLIPGTLVALESIITTNGVEFIDELVQLCSDQNYQPSETAGDIMDACGLLTYWNPSSRQAVIHDDIQRVVRAAVQGQGMDLRIVHDIVASTEMVDG